PGLPASPLGHGRGAGSMIPGAPQHTIPQLVGMLPVTELSHVKSGVIPEAARKAALLGLAMMKRVSTAELLSTGLTADGPPRSSISTWTPPPSATHLKTVRRVCATRS